MIAPTTEKAYCTASALAWSSAVCVAAMNSVACFSTSTLRPPAVSSERWGDSRLRQPCALPLYRQQEGRVAVGIRAAPDCADRRHQPSAAIEHRVADLDQPPVR